MKLIKYQPGGMLVGARKHLSGTENKIYQDALKRGNKRLVNYFESKINQGLGSDKSEKQAEIERLAELQGRDSRDNTNLVSTQADANTWKQHIPLYNTLTGNSPKLAYSDFKEAVVGNPERTQKDVEDKARIDAEKSPVIKNTLLKAYNQREQEKKSGHTLSNLASGTLNAIEPIVNKLFYLKRNGGKFKEGGSLKSKLTPNKPIRTPNHPTKSHVVLAKEGSKEKLIRFGQQGVKGSPHKEGESQASRKRREAFKARHSCNTATSKLTARHWACVTKW